MDIDRAWIGYGGFILGGGLRVGFDSIFFFPQKEQNMSLEIYLAFI